MLVAITGSEGTVGRVLLHGLAGEFELRALVRTPQAFPAEVADVGDFDRLVQVFAGAQAVIHLAAAAALDASWEEVRASNIDGTRNVYEAARIAGVRRVIFASSGHVVGLAEERAGPAIYALDDRRVFDERTPVEPDSLYAVSKVYGEALGRYYAAAHGLSVICVRLGTVLPDDNPRTDHAGRGRSAMLSPAERYPRIRAKWLSHRDCCQIFTRGLQVESLDYAIVFATSNNPRQLGSLEAARRLLNYQPQDAAPLKP